MIQLLIAILAAAALVVIFKSRERKNPSAWRARELPSNVDISDAPQQDPAAPAEENELDHSEINRSYRIADMHFARGDFKEAEKYFIKVLALHEQHPEALNRLGVIYIHQNNPGRAEIIFRKLFSVTQKEPAYYCNYGRCLYNQGRLAEAIEAYENAVKLDCTRPSRFVSIGQIYYEQKEYEKAHGYFCRALELDPQNFEYLSLTAELAELVGDNERLIKSLKKILEIDPYNESAKERLAKLVIPDPDQGSI